ncbi:MAG TPA: class I SAM-dependent methyltransferase [Polyangiaceae bacterium]|nr:class I SAM-dependent methyltransferase [Polyangiaceae bacterium]
MSKASLGPILPEWSGIHSIHYQFLSNQQHMLVDAQRTGAYHRGITHNRADFEGKTVLDVGAGTGILSLFAAQAGARKVYACEGTPSSEYARALVEANGYADRIEVVRSRLDALELPEQVDVIISEPWGFFLFHERMVEAFLIARDRFLKPGGRMFPTSGRVWLAPFTDPRLFQDRVTSAAFWEQHDFYGLDLTAMAQTATDELFWMPALGHVPPRQLMASPSVHAFDFERMPLADLAEIRLPFEFVASHPGPINGLAGWFDVSFDGTTERVVLSTAPDAIETHWLQLRFVLKDPFLVSIGDRLSGSLVLQANPQSSYTATFEATLNGASLPSAVFGIHGYFPYESDD